VKVLNSNEVIYVDDSRNDRELVADCFQSSRLRNPFVALGSGADVLHYLQAVEAGEKPMPALILLDVNMPVMDGFEVLREIRSHDAFRAIPLVMLTSSDSLSDRERAEALGAHDLRVKPFDLREYVALFDSLEQ